MCSGNKKLSDIINLCLDDEHLEIIKLRFIKGYSQKEIAKIYKCDQSKISRLCKKALDKMREYYLKEEVDIY